MRICGPHYAFLAYIMSRVMKNLFYAYANNTGADQPAHTRSLISTFVVGCLDSIIPLVSISETSSLSLAFVAAQAGLCLPWSKTPKTGFLVTRLYFVSIKNKKAEITDTASANLVFFYVRPSDFCLFVNSVWTMWKKKKKKKKQS